jgi:hypothetical protein
MYIDKFHFSPFKIEDNVLSIYNGEYIIKSNKIYKDEKEISNETFYNEFVKISEGKWFANDFILAFQDKKDAIPDALFEFAVYCDFNLSFLSQKQSNINSNNMRKNNKEDLISNDKEKTQHSKNSIITFFIVGVILLFTVNEPLNPLYTTLFFFIGMFVVSILSVPSFLLKSKFNKKIYFIFELFYNIVVTTILFYLFLAIQ